jgi:hypothetical protein
MRGKWVRLTKALYMFDVFSGEKRGVPVPVRDNAVRQEKACHLTPQERLVKIVVNKKLNANSSCNL